MDEKKRGYVYILTNPSFREDWVKIGKTANSVEKRVKELDGTAVPLPFEIYASLKTSKYAEVEKVVHDIIDSLTDLRIRQNREFFNITPSEALKILKQQATLLDDAEIKEYKKEEVPVVSPKVEKSQPRHAKRKAFWTEFIQYCKDNDGVFAKHTPIGDNWLGKGIGAPHGIVMKVLIGYDFLRTEIAINTGNKDTNKKAFDILAKDKEAIEKEYGKSLIWERNTDKITCSIKDEIESHPFDMEDKTSAFEFLKTSSEKMADVFHNRLVDIKL